MGPILFLAFCIFNRALVQRCRLADHTCLIKQKERLPTTTTSHILLLALVRTHGSLTWDVRWGWFYSDRHENILVTGVNTHCLTTYLADSMRACLPTPFLLSLPPT